MVLSRLLANDSVVGVDIGSNTIKIVQADATKQGFRISRVALCPCPPESVKEGVVVNVPEVAAALQFALRTAGIRATSAVAAIAGPGVLVRHVQLPKMTEQVLRKSIYFEAGKFISASIEDSVVEFDIQGEGDEPGQMKVMLVAAPKVMIDSRVNALEQAGLEPLAIDVEAFATFRALVENNPDQSLMGSTIALLDIGASHTEINLVSKGNIALTRTVPIAGTSLTNAIKNAMGCSDEEAEQQKHSLDMTELADLPPGATNDPALKAVQNLCDEILREIRRSINYFQSQLPEGAGDSTVERIILTGGGSRLKGLGTYARSRLNIEVSVGNPALSSLIDPSACGNGVSEEDIVLLAVAFGVAIKEMPRLAHLPVAA